VLLTMLISICLLTCSKDEKDEKPKITGCKSFEYKGTTYNNVGCAYGVKSFNFTQTINGVESPCFHIECSGGCISSVSLCSGGKNMGKTIVGPEEE
ncbi:MAG: hypothetical protein SCK70_11005, partial [bacterium]|nr:hypothetical protein [bacterium]